jgi:hypothetical protein
MPLPVPNLDDRRFDDLVAEARARLSTHLPELTHIAPGDPAHVFIDLFAWLTETILFRANLIPERQRRVVMNLLQIPLRNARPSRGVVSIDAGPRSATLPPLVDSGAQLSGAGLTFTTVGELQPTFLGMIVMIKQLVREDELRETTGLTLQDLQEQYGLRAGETPQPFQPIALDPGKAAMSLSRSLDKAYYLAMVAPKPLLPSLAQARQSLAGITLNIAVAPADELEGGQVDSLAPRQLVWSLMSRNEDGEPLFLPLEIVDDSSRGGRRTGVVRLRLPANPALFQSLPIDDPMFAGVGEAPPELPEPATSESVAFWLRLQCREEPNLPLGYLGVNGVDVVGQGRRSGLIVGRGTGAPDQVIKLPDTDVDPDTLQLEVEEDGAWAPWSRVDFLLGHQSGSRVYKLDPTFGYVYFGDGLGGGKRPPAGMRIRAASYRYGGGSRTNVGAGVVKELSGGGARLTVRQEWPCAGGVDAETVDQAERRIPQFLTHRNRAVTRQDFKVLAENNPVNSVARAEVIEGFLPGPKIQAARENVPGVVSVFVLPPRAAPALRQTPKPTQGLLKDVFSYLLERVLIGTELYVLSPEFVPLALGVKVDVLDRETERQTLRDVESALVSFLWPLPPGGPQGQGWPMGGRVKTAELATRAARVAGVRSVNAVSLFQYTDKRWRRLVGDRAIELKKYQFPELLGVTVGTGPGAPEFPGGIGPLEGAPSGGPARNVPTPVIPEVC